MKKCMWGVVLLLSLIVGMNLFGISAEAKYRRICKYPYETCRRECYHDYSYCYSHRCGHSSCGNARLRLGEYCSKHTCKEEGCYEEKSGEHDYCSEHLPKKSADLCVVYDCNRKHLSNSKLCSVHECKVSGCHSYVVGNGLCYKHKYHSSGNSSSKKKTAGYDSFYEDDFESFYDENKEYYDDEDDAYEAWEEIYGD